MWVKSVPSCSSSVISSIFGSIRNETSPIGGSGLFGFSTVSFGFPCADSHRSISRFTIPLGLLLRRTMTWLITLGSPLALRLGFFATLAFLLDWLLRLDSLESTLGFFVIFLPFVLLLLLLPLVSSVSVLGSFGMVFVIFSPLVLLLFLSPLVSSESVLGSFGMVFVIFSPFVLHLLLSSPVSSESVLGSFGMVFLIFSPFVLLLSFMVSSESVLGSLRIVFVIFSPFVLLLSPPESVLGSFGMDSFVLQSLSFPESSESIRGFFATPFVEFILSELSLSVRFLSNLDPSMCTSVLESTLEMLYVLTASFSCSLSSRIPFFLAKASSVFFCSSMISKTPSVSSMACVLSSLGHSL
mmetsp:Transcript_21074/g.40034  ORF Transcript_21074/g.40034 Transcript_21074/m.40034 type:complete len:355 (-) Transcript_21074:1864-2928(-)